MFSILPIRPQNTVPNNKPVVAVMDFRIKNIPQMDGEVVVDYLTMVLFKTGYFTVKIVQRDKLYSLSLSSL